MDDETTAGHTVRPMSTPQHTLDELWDQLGLDSLPGDAGAADDLRATRSLDHSTDFLQTTLDNPTERVDLPKISSNPPSDPAGPPALDDLVVVGVLGEGGMGKVLLSKQRSLGREVAVKVARKDATMQSMQALIREARTTGGLEHPGIIPVYALGSDVDGRPALVMKRVDGVSWARLLHDENDPGWERVGHRGDDELAVHIDILIHVCNAIAFAHSKGVLHRDIKPSNVLIGEFGEVYVADWGVAISKAAGSRRKPALVGTPVYLAPEMVTGDDTKMDERTDVFLLGATLFEVLSGKPPFGGFDLRSVLVASLEGRPGAIPVSAPSELAEICRRAMAVKPADRFQTATELRDALIAWVRHRGAVALTRASQDQLDQLLGLIRSGSKDRAVLMPLLSACRFGFTQALREWPQNEAAKDGLRQSVEAAARFEASQGNLDAVVALLAELEKVPDDLTQARGRLEESARLRAARDARLTHLTKEMDPSISRAERTRLFVVLGAVIIAVVALVGYVPRVRDAYLGSGHWFLPLTMTTYLTVFLIALVVGRKSLLATRLNRRVAGIVAIAIIGPLANRIFGAVLGVPIPHTMVADLVISASVAAAAALTLHWGFVLSACSYFLGALCVMAWPQWAAQIYGVAAVIAMVGVTQTQWRNELSSGNAEP